MDALFSRWKTAIHSTEQFQDYQKIPATVELRKGSSKSKQKNSKKKDQQQSNASKTSLKRQEPSSKKFKNVSENHIEAIENLTNSIIVLFPSHTQKVKAKVQNLVIDFTKTILTSEQNLLTVELANQSNKVPFSVYSDLQKKYFENEKEKHYFKLKAQNLAKKCEKIDGDNQRMAKLEKIIDNSIQREADLKKEAQRLEKELQSSELRQIEQQKTFQKEIATIHQLINTLKLHLPPQR